MDQSVNPELTIPSFFVRCPAKSTSTPFSNSTADVGHAVLHWKTSMLAVAVEITAVPMRCVLFLNIFSFEYGYASHFLFRKLHHLLVSSRLTSLPQCLPPHTAIGAKAFSYETAT